ncbi:MAG: type IX secretion system sortase PorU [Prevotella sp.]|nr:type IX secretion system sortase PorU [Prevotella sp.]MCI7045673.1 type IX secretion system sortase PorU [Prevotella sp.]
MTKQGFLTIMILICSVAHAVAQGFFNLTAQQVRIDDHLPCFSYSHDLGFMVGDSVYSVDIEYPEFIDMTEADIERYHKITSDSLPEMPVVVQNVAVARKRGSLDIAFVPLVYREGKYMKLVSFKLTIKGHVPARSQRMAAGNTTISDLSQQANAPQQGRYADHSVLASGRWVKISVAESGVYEITDQLIKRAGLNPSRTKIYGYGGNLQPEYLTGTYLAATDDLAEVPTCTVGGRRLFYAKGPVSWTNYYQRVRNPYSTVGCYFLTESDGDPLTVDEQTFISSFYPSDDFNNSLYEIDDYAWLSAGRNLYDARLYSIGQSNDYHLKPKGDTKKGMVTVVITANEFSQASVAVNDSVVGTINVPACGSYESAVAATGRFDVDNLSADTKISITQNRGGQMRLDYISIYTQQPANAPDLAAGSFPVPDYMYAITNQDHHADSPVDMVILLPLTQKLREQAERLKTLHEQHDGMTVRIVPVDELYNEFSSGTPDATAYKRYMKMFYDRAQSDNDIPKYLLLFGDGGWDNRMLSPEWKGYSPDDFLLCYESDNSFSKTASYVSDDFYCLLDDNEKIYDATGRYQYTGKPDVAVGRFPVRTIDEARVMVDKIEAYLANSQAGQWQNTVVVMGDDGDNNTHMIGAEEVANVVEKYNPTVDVRRIMWDAYTRETSSTGNTYPEVTSLIKQYMKNGALMMNYSGHGAEYSLSHELVMKLQDFKDAKSQKLPLWITASCDIMPFDSQTENIGEVALTNPNGGAVAFLGTTRTVYSSSNTVINKLVTRNLLAIKDGKRVSIGEAVRLAKDTLASTYVYTKPDDKVQAGVDALRDYTANKLQFALAGDPALVLALPTMPMTIESINGVPLGNDMITLKAGDEVVVNGYVADGQSVCESFSGLVTATVRDAVETVVCKQNADKSIAAFTYKERKNTLFSGSDSIRAGRFSFRFVVPKDISYSEGSAQIMLYAVSNDKTMEASGVEERFKLGGSEALVSDSIGPSVYCYLNSSAFTNGDRVNATPYFVAEIADESGINVSGGSIGHSLQLVVDGDMMQTYQLNDYFAFDFGNYKSGRVGFSLPEMSEGKHRLKFQAWDIYNNVSIAQLDFVVATDADPKLFSLDATHNPAVTSTTFRIVHDRIGSDIDVSIEVYDMAGRMVWTAKDVYTPSDNMVEIPWNLCSNEGNKVATGVYLYRARIDDENGGHTSKTNKLIVLNNK